ncbi:type II toxin-antitoxin system RelE family toxin [Actinomadura roseirufa]|uniref:type II toxin-antitoxin system RelE family toxin n=1 Tax=Actinomadura roseirufa TaxID=2094049 RepID=UPI001041BD2F|nr:hypothetical protein [Actinomadura roseirufa]
MTYRVELSRHVLKQLADLPLSVQVALAETLAVVAVAPYDPTTSDPTVVEGVRQAGFAEVGLVEYLIWDDLLVVVALNLLWGG